MRTPSNPPPVSEHDVLWRVQQVAQYLAGCHTHTILRLEEHDPTFPRSFRVGGLRVWRAADIRAYAEAKLAKVVAAV
jgi:predicted DNA-binding transcriptional regulator AlpA